MNDDVNLSRLLGLRHRSERRALDAVATSQQACRRAASNAEEALARVARQADEARAAERGLVELMLGRPVSAATLGRFQADCDARSAAAMDLRSIAAAAQAHLKECEAALGEARVAHRSLQRAATKLDLMVKRRTLERDKRNQALAEAFEEDIAAMRSGKTDAAWI